MAAQKRVDNKRRILKEGESQLPDGRYRYRYFDMDGCRQVVYSWKLVERDRMPPGKKDDLSLREKERQIERDMEDSIKTGRDAKITLNQMFETYMTGKISLKQSTRTNYIYMYTHYVQDGFGKKLLKDIRYSDVKAFYNSLIVEKGFKANSMEIINTLIHPALTLAVRDGYIRFNPSDGVMMEIKKSHQWEKTHRHALTIEEQSAFLNYIASNEQYKHWLPMFTLFLGTGCRVGEIVGLRWEDCDFKQRIININHTLIYRLQDDGRVEYLITTPKTEAGIREIPMMDEVYDALVQLKNWQVLVGDAHDEIDGYSGFILTNRFGNVCNPHTINRVIERMYKGYNKQETEQARAEGRQPMLIRHFSVHNLRHTFCTRFCENETNLKVIQDIMGHADITTTMNIYAEATKEKKQQAMANLNGKMYHLLTISGSSLKGMAIVKLYKNIKISEASAAPENRFLMRCTVSGVHLTGGMLLHDNRAFIGLSNDSSILFCKEDVHNAQLHRIQFR